jgi:hypothetical protein
MIAVPAGRFTEMVGQYCMEKIPGLKLASGMYQAMMVVNDDNDFVAGVVFTNFRDIDVEISCVSETPAAWRPEVCKAIFTYIFDQLGCVRCTSITTRPNRKARGFLESLGFTLEGNVRLGYDGQRDALIYGLLRSECRFLADDSERDDGKEERPETPASAGPGDNGEGSGGAEHRRRDSPSEPEPD